MNKGWARCAITILLVTGSISLTGCTGLSPVVLDAYDQAGRAADIYHQNIRASSTALLADLHSVLMDYAADLAEANMQAAAEDGAILTPHAQSVLKEYIKRIQAVQAKIAGIQGKLDASQASRREYEQLQAGIRRVLVQLVRRRQAEDRLQAVGVEAAKRGAQAAKRAAAGQ